MDTRVILFILKRYVPLISIVLFLLYTFFGSQTIRSTELAKELKAAQLYAELHGYRCTNVQQFPFRFDPSPEVMPFKERVAIMLVTSDSSTQARNDMYFLNSLSMIYALRYQNATKVSDDIEIAVIVTETISQEKRASIKELGARLILVNSMQFSGISDQVAQWKNCFTKLYMFQMIFYQQILYLDTDFTFLRSPEPLFEIMTAKKKEDVTKYFFGASPDWGLPQGTFNAGMFLFEPSCDYFSQLMNLVHRTSEYDSIMMEQGLLNWFFQHDGTGPSGIRWFAFAPQYNFQWVNHRPYEESSKAVILHAKVWKEPVPPWIYLKFKEGLLNVQRFQRRLRKESDVVYVPDTQEDFLRMIKAKTFGVPNKY
jgi:alpha-N-acetylglucosamine transferase